MNRTALVTGVGGQDGAYLSKLLLERSYRVVGQVRPGQPPQLARLDELGIAGAVELVAWDLFDLAALTRELERLRPDEIYNLAGPSSVASSFQEPIQALEVNAVAAARLLEGTRLACPEAFFFQPSSAEMFGLAATAPQSETTPFHPRSPYAVSKLFSHWQTISYRESFGLFACCGIMFNHESPLRGRQFVTRKISLGLAEIKLGRRERLSLGNLDVTRDWGFAGDYVDGMWRMMQQTTVSDYVLATGVSTSVRRFVELAAEALGIAIDWSGAGVSEVGIDRKSGRTIVDVDPAFFRPAELTDTVGDPRRAARELGWRASTTVAELAAMMVDADQRRLVEDRLLF
jgi:GDPmannose 4,6-dehydratase